MKRRTGMIKAAALLLLLLFLLPSGTNKTFAEAEAPEMGQVTADQVNMREQPNTDCEILAEVPGGTAVEVLGKDGSWYRVLYHGTVGYIRQDYLFVNSTGSRGAYVKTDGAALRGGPSEDSYVVMQLSAGQGIKVKALVDGEWFFGSANDKTGFVHRSYLEITSSST
ncbi:MAG: SH3 domain-containing protein, partial [Clostridia bacterium]|nr:SH3 domain-containing protein [Clostridia bacterium]